MTPLSFIGKYPNYSEYSRKSKILLFAYYLRRYDGTPEFAPTDIKRCFSDSLQKAPSDLSNLLKTLAKGRNSPLMKVGTGARYALSLPGLQEIEGLPAATAGALPDVSQTFVSAATAHLKKSLAKITDPDRKEYLAEAVSCIGVGARRATIIMTWLATMDHLFEHVLAHKLAAFNAALKKRGGRDGKVVIQARDDFADLKESVFIETCRSARVITNDVRKILDEKLGTRNSCAHPAAITISDSKVVDFVEDLVSNVIARYRV